MSAAGIPLQHLLAELRQAQAAFAQAVLDQEECRQRLVAIEAAVAEAAREAADAGDAPHVVPAA